MKISHSARRRYLFLQGCTSPFFARLGDRLRDDGHEVYRLNFNAGDALYWWRRPAWHFRASVAELAGYLEQLFGKYNFTDVVMLGDTRPVNAEALPVARRLGARIHVLEEGYIRPNWLTLEEGGINGNSPLPRDPDWYREAVRLIPDYGDGEAIANPVRLLALHELGYHLPNALNFLLYPGYQTHRPHSSPVELYGWALRFARMPWYRRCDRAKVGALLGEGLPFFVLPLQLNSDAQIHTHSNVGDMPGVLQRVVESFFCHAPAEARLVIKNHPLDTGFAQYPNWIRSLERRYGEYGRLVYLESGHLPTILDYAQGVVTVNSSVGPSALLHRCPVVALGAAVYDLPGLTFQGLLDDFWTQGEPADRILFHAFRRTVVHVSQINGGFYTGRGIELGTDRARLRLERDQSPLDALLEATHGNAAGMRGAVMAAE